MVVAARRCTKSNNLVASRADLLFLMNTAYSLPVHEERMKKKHVVTMLVWSSRRNFPFHYILNGYDRW